MSDPRIRAEAPGDAAAVHTVNLAAFGRPLEAELVDRLRAEADPYLSFVAEVDDTIVGHILFTEVTIDGAGGQGRALGLAPMAVLPGHQRGGVGTALVEHGLGVCRAAGHRAVVVLGHPAYYPRFGFEQASRHGLTYENLVPNAAFMAIALAPGALDEIEGTVTFHRLFRGL